MSVVAYETSSNTENFLFYHALSLDNVCNRRLFSIPSRFDDVLKLEFEVKIGRRKPNSGALPTWVTRLGAINCLVVPQNLFSLLLIPL